MWQAVEGALRREKLCGKVTANRGRICAETGPEDMVRIVAKVSYQAELTVQPGFAAFGWAGPTRSRWSGSWCRPWKCDSVGGFQEADAEAPIRRGRGCWGR